MTHVGWSYCESTSQSHTDDPETSGGQLCILGLWEKLGCWRENATYLAAWAAQTRRLCGEKRSTPLLWAAVCGIVTSANSRTGQSVSQIGRFCSVSLVMMLMTSFLRGTDVNLRHFHLMIHFLQGRTLFRVEQNALFMYSKSGNYIKSTHFFERQRHLRSIEMSFKSKTLTSLLYDIGKTQHFNGF